ncbi:MAG: hypothetical protein JJU36_02700, partial [Phycisphaeraceae bacterium]|nr:hypothetical protein [Phycisphaeraceae bacterium]
MKPGTDQTVYERAIGAARVGLAVQVAITLIVGILAVYTENPALRTAMWHLLGGWPIWIILLLIYQQHRMERIETLEAEALAAGKARGSELFEADADELSLTRRRLDRLYRWGLPAVSGLMAVYLAGVGLWRFFPALGAYRTPTQEGASNRLLDTVLGARAMDADPLIVMVVVALVTFGLFAVAR